MELEHSDFSSVYEDMEAKAEEATSSESDGEETHEEDHLDLNPLEKLAKEKMGWRPGGRKSAEEWILNYNANIPVQRQNRELQKEIREMRQEMAEMRQETTQSKQKSIDDQIAELKAKRREAAQEGDDDKVEELSDQITELAIAQKSSSKKAEEKSKTGEDDGPSGPIDPTTDPYFSAWVDANPWFDNDQEMNARAVYVFNTLNGRNEARIAEGKQPYTIRQMLDKAAKDVEKRFFGDGDADNSQEDDHSEGDTKMYSMQKKRQTAPVNSGNRASASNQSTNGKGFQQMDANAKEAFEAFKRENPNIDSKEFAKVWHETDQKGAMATRFMGD